MKNMIIFMAVIALIFGHVAGLRAQDTANTAALDISGFSALAISDAFNALKKPEIIMDEQVLINALVAAFSGRQLDAVEFAVNVLRAPRVVIDNGREVNRGLDFFIAKRIFRQYPGIAIEVLKREYDNAGGVLRCNIIEMLGSLNTDDASVKEILASALENDTFCDIDFSEQEGVSLRISDTAYNQLAAKNKVSGVLRTIGPAHRVEDRDRNIEALRKNINR